MGLETNTNPRLSKYLVEEKYFSSTPIIVLDIGARDGFEELWDIFKEDAHLIGFEANQEEYEDLNKQNSKTNQTFYPYAIHRDKQRRTFFETSLPASSGFCEPDETFLERFWTAPNKKIIKQYPLDTIDLDTLSKTHSLPPIDFMKIDTEGCEFDILQGARQCIDNGILGLNIEAWMTQVHKEQGVFCDIDRFLRDRNYEVFNMSVYRYSRKPLANTTHLFSHGKGQVLWSQVLYFKDVVKELRNTDFKNFWNLEKILKMVCFYELYNLNDCGAELLIESHQQGFLSDEEKERFLDLIVPVNPGEQILNYQEYQAFTIYQDIIAFLYELQRFKPEDKIYVNSMLHSLKRSFTRLALDSIIKYCAYLEDLDIPENSRACWLSSYYKDLKTYRETIIHLTEEKKIIHPYFN